MDEQNVVVDPLDAKIAALRAAQKARRIINGKIRRCEAKLAALQAELAALLAAQG